MRGTRKGSFGRERFRGREVKAWYVLDCRVLLGNLINVIEAKDGRGVGNRDYAP
jgi:hypothetical protein